jgi:hypothetical protein
MRDVRTLSLGVIRQGHRRQGFFHAAILTLAPHLLCRLVLAQADVDWVAARGYGGPDADHSSPPVRSAWDAMSLPGSLISTATRR